MIKKKWFLVFCLLFSFLFSACKINIVKEFDAETKKIIDDIKYNYEAVAGIQRCTSNSGCTQDIIINKSENGIKEFTFWIGGGCTSSGCPNRHIWYFSYSNGEINKTGEDIRGVDPLQ